MFGDVRQPEPVRFRASEVAVDEIRRGRRVRDLAIARPAWQASDSEAAHHQFDGAPRDRHLTAQHELGVDTTGAVGLTGLVVDLADHVGDHRVAHRAC